VKNLLLIITLFLTTFGYSQCPDDLTHSNGSSCDDCSDIIYVYDINNIIIDSFQCNVNGGGFYNCNLEDSLLVSGVYLSFSDSVDGSCIYDTTGAIITGEGLPIELKEFYIAKEDGVNVVNWSTYSELNNYYYIIERLIEDMYWEHIYYSNGAGTTTLISTYKYYDRDFDNKINYYRLTQVDFDGNKETFDVVAVDNRDNKKRLIKTVNLMGQEVKPDDSGFIIEIYSDGTTRKLHKN